MRVKVIVTVPTIAMVIVIITVIVKATVILTVIMRVRMQNRHIQKKKKHASKFRAFCDTCPETGWVLFKKYGNIRPEAGCCFFSIEVSRE